MNNGSRILCIGLSKTGTTSLHEAFLALGLKSCHHCSHMDENGKLLIERAREEGRKLLDYIDDYEAYSDMELYRYFKELDKQYPCSKFILNTRDSHDWIESRIKHAKRWNERNPNKRQRSTGERKRKKLLKLRDRVYAETTEYFEGRPDFLMIDICRGEGWEKLCPFLGKEIPPVPFPHKNKKVPEG